MPSRLSVGIRHDSVGQLGRRERAVQIQAYRGLGSGWASAEQAAPLLSAQKDLGWWPAGQGKVRDKDGAVQNTEGTEAEERLPDGLELSEVSWLGSWGERRGQLLGFCLNLQKKFDGAVKIWRLVKRHQFFF